MNASQTQPTNDTVRQATPTFTPQVDLLESADDLVIIADMPGVSPAELDIQFENGALKIHGRVTPRMPAQTGFHMREYGVADYHREFRIQDHIDSERIAAEYRDGVLTLRLPKTAASKPRKIEVKPL